jgi:hypothetical protein
VVRTNLAKLVLDDAATVGAYGSLAEVERAFRSLKTVDIQAADLPLDGHPQATTGRTDDGLPVHWFQTLLVDLATWLPHPGHHCAQREIRLHLSHQAHADPATRVRTAPRIPKIARPPFDGDCPHFCG